MNLSLENDYKHILIFCYCISMAATTVAMDMYQLSDIANGLPQNFLVTETNARPDDEPEKQPANQDILSSIRYDFVSEDPVRETSSGGVFPRADLESTRYKDNQKALEAMLEIQRLAHPDMGLSYEWDYLILNNDSIYHLHASCVLSEDWFNKIASNLDERVALSANKHSSGIYCRCGGGCKQTDSRPDPGERSLVH